MISSLELARLAGLSQGTVDRALHDRPGINPKTKAFILELAAKHGYRPHPAARELLTGERKTVGAIIPVTQSVFFMDLVNSIREPLVAEGYRFVITQITDESGFLEALSHLDALRTRMVVAVPPSSDIEIPASITKTLDVAALVNPCRGKAVRNMIPDEVQTGRIGVEYLFSKGHRRIIHLRPFRDSPAIRDRARGYEKAMVELGLPAKVIQTYDGPELLKHVREFAATAIFCHNDWLALSAIRALCQGGLNVPQDISILGVDDSPSFVSLCPDITTLHYPAESIAQAVAAWIGGKQVPPIAAVHVVERNTVHGPKYVGLNRQ